MTSEIRQNKVTGEWVIFAPGRGERPQDMQPQPVAPQDLPRRSPTCPFCPGNEERLPYVILEVPGDNDVGWQTRVVPNKFPALVPQDGMERACHGIYLTAPGYGRHEVIVESPRHDLSLAEFQPQAMVDLIETYHRRYVDLMAEHRNMMTILFRNHGARAGTSLVHPHSQLVVTGVVPRMIRWREEEAERYYDRWNRCIVCDMLDYEAQVHRRVLGENASFVAFVPFAAEVPCEIWIVPKHHQPDFGAITDTEKSDLARMLQEMLVRLHHKLHDPAYNYVIHSAPRFRADEPQLHWYVQIQPRLTTPAGFEMGSGMRINPSLPEDDADLLNGA